MTTCTGIVKRFPNQPGTTADAFLKLNSRIPDFSARTGAFTLAGHFKATATPRTFYRRKDDVKIKGIGYKWPIRAA